MAEVEEPVAAIAHTDPRSPGDLTPVVLDCEYALLGTVLRAESVQQAAQVLAAISEDDFADPHVREAIALARAAVQGGNLPAPSVLLARLTTDHGVHRYQLMARLLVDAWWAGPPPIAAWPLVIAVLEGSYRRAVRRWAERVHQASDGPLDVLGVVLGNNTETRAAWHRLTTARRTTTRPPTTDTTTPTPRPGRAHSGSPHPHPATRPA